ncbi:CHAT domain-containing protein [Paraburkholderia sp. WC7.3b]|uniref:CHAT domain-containing protein n=1 Tax=Paraburkholderia podalyriae TaxID=1938811 RepID=A0ABR7Q1U2_9BURK|nr:CHAT domain-containing protein [Paraburkholderia podalyriae]
MATLVIRHEPGGEGYRFSVQRVSATGVKAAPAVELADPLRRMLGDTQLTLGEELAWYLEQYLDYPFGPNEQRAKRVTGELRSWGTEAFIKLFDAGQACNFYSEGTRTGHTELHLIVASDDAAVLAWPWEALHDPLVGDLAQLCRIERQLDRLSDPPPLPENLSSERIGILLITARPDKDQIAYRCISRPLVELIQNRGLPAAVKVLRPPTFAQLCAELHANPGAYHIVHFDGHGGFAASPAGSPSAHAFRGPQGQLVFEEEDGSADPVTADQLSQLLREHRIPIAVLNACQSGMQSAEAEDAFASVATALLRAGVRSVVAMGYSLYVSAAREFLPAFYERLFDSGSIAEATRAGRQALFAQPRRLSARGPYPLQDWLLPVLYQQQPLELKFAQHAQTVAPNRASLPDDARLNFRDAPYGQIGRDSVILALERAMRRPPAGLLVHGLGGVGKTTLVRGFIEWLAETDGLPGDVLWLSFEGIRSADYVINRLVEAQLGTDAMAVPDAQKKLAQLVRKLREKVHLIVWDNFESASGAADVGLDSPMPPEDRQRLKALLEQLRHGKSKVLITSRSDEAWLGPTSCFRIPLGGLKGEERWALADAILQDQGIRADRSDPAMADLLNALEGHPLMMRALLPKLGAQTAASVLKALEQYVPDAHNTDPVEQRLYATLRFVEEGLPDALKPLLYPLGLHESCVDVVLLAMMAERIGQSFDSTATGECLQRLEAAGLARGIGHPVFRLHPALTRYLRARADRLAGDDAIALAWQRTFVEVMAIAANSIVPLPRHEQGPFFALLGECVTQAQRLAEQIATYAYPALTHSLGIHALIGTTCPWHNATSRPSRGIAKPMNRKANMPARTASSETWPYTGATLPPPRPGTARRWRSRSASAMSRARPRPTTSSAAPPRSGATLPPPRPVTARRWRSRSASAMSPARPRPTASSAGWPRIGATSRPPRPGTASRWRSASASAMSPAWSRPTTSLASPPRSGATSPLPRPGTARPWRSRSASAMSPARPPPITGSASPPRCGATSRPPRPGTASRWRSRSASVMRSARPGPTTSSAGWPKSGATSRPPRPGTASRWRSTSAWAMRPARPGITPCWARWPKSGATSRPPRPGTASRWRSRSASAMQTARP